MQTNPSTNSKKISVVILLAFLVLPIYGQTEKPLSEFEQHKDYQDLQKNINAYEKAKDSALYDAALKLAETILTQTENIYEKEHAEVAKSYHRIGSILKEKADYDKTLEWHNKGYALNKKLSGEDSVTTARSFFYLGETYIYKGEYLKAKEFLDKAYTIQKKKLGGEHTEIADTIDELGALCYCEGDYDKAIKHCNEVLTIRLKVLNVNHKDVASSYGSLGSVYDSKGEYDKAIEYYTKSLAIRLKTLGGEHPYVATSFGSLGSVYGSKGEYDKAIEYYTKSLAIRLKTLGGEHPDVATSYDYLGSVYGSKGEYDKAIEYFTKSLAILLKTLGGEHPGVAGSYNNFGLVYDSTGEYEKAIEYYTKSLAIYIKTLGGEHPNVAISYNNLGLVYNSKGEYDKAIEYYTKSLAILLKILGGEHSKVAISYNNLGLVYNSKGEYDKAIEYYTKSLAIYIKTLGGEHPYVALLYWNIGALYKSQKDYPKSIQNLQKAIHIYEKLEERDHYITTYITLKEVYVEQNQTDMAIHALKQAMELVLKFRTEMGRDKDAFTERFLYVFKDLLKLYLESEQLEKALEVSEKMRGLSISENFNLKYALSHGGVSQVSSETLLKLRSELESLASERIAAKRLGDKGKQREEELWKRIRTTEQEANTLDKELIRTMPIYAQLRKIESPTITALQRQLKKTDKTFLEYSLFIDKDGKESLHAFVISPKSFESVDLGKDLDITRRVNNLRLIISQYPNKRTFIALKRKDGALVLSDAGQCKGFHKGEKCSKFITDYESKLDEFGNFKLKEVILGIQERKVDAAESAQLMKQYSKEIYDIVIKPIESFTLTNIIICPDAALFTIPFAALITDNNKYLVEKYSISLIQSATAWMKLQREEKREYTQPLFAMGNSIYGMGHSNTKGISGQRGLSTENKREVRDLDDVKMNNLPGSLEELKFLSKTIYNSDSFNEHIISGIRANKDELYKRFAVNQNSQDKYRIIHFSVHGLFFSDSPELNSLALTSRETASKYSEEELKSFEEKNGKIERDGFLKMGDVAELDLKTDLLIMSACETSLGTVKAGEGMVCLPQAFLLGGAKNVMATLWSVDDNGTMLFFKEYYKNLIDKKLSSVEALKLTQKNLYKKTKAANVNYTDPFYWSPFVVYGK